MIRARFYCNPDDYRPIKFPPPGPYWCTGTGFNTETGEDEYSVVVAYFDSGEQILEFWPDAFEIDIHEHDVEPQYTDRFPKPEWYTTDSPPA